MEFMTGVKKTDLLELPELQDKSLAGQTVKVNGAVHTIRDMGDVAFGIWRHRLRAPFGGAGKGNTWELSGRKKSRPVP